MLTKLLQHPSTRGLDLDNPKTTFLRRKIIQEKQFLHRLYREWYTEITTRIPSGEGAVLELGSGAGFLQDVVPALIPSEIMICPDIRVVLDGQSLPFVANSLRSIILVDVLHHLPCPRHFFADAGRCVRSAGRIIMIEPWVTSWSTFIFQNLHHEPFRPDSVEWEFPSTGPLSGANGALPWIMLERDRDCFESEFPEWKIVEIKPIMPFRYLVSGGVSMRNLMPSFSFPIWRLVESIIQPWMRHLAMFAIISIEKR